MRDFDHFRLARRLAVVERHPLEEVVDRRSVVASKARPTVGSGRSLQA